MKQFFSKNVQIKVYLLNTAVYVASRNSCLQLGTVDFEFLPLVLHRNDSRNFPFGSQMHNATFNCDKISDSMDSESQFIIFEPRFKRFESQVYDQFAYLTVEPRLLNCGKRFTTAGKERDPFLSRDRS